MLCLGIGGGGDVVGALATADLAERLGTPAVVGGITWERSVVDPAPGPRTLDEATGLGERLDDVVAIATAETRGPGGFRFAESGMALALDAPVVLVDPTRGPARTAAGLDAAAARLGCDLVALVDVGGDVLGHGDEPGLASPLADAVLLAATAHLRTPALLAVFGAGCDGELRPAEVAERLAEVEAAGGGLGTWRLDEATLAALEAGVGAVTTEASTMALRCARGQTGSTTIRRGRRSVQLSAVGALTFYFDPLVAMATAARLADAVADAPSLLEANSILRRLGVRSELDYEIDAAREGLDF